LDCFAFARNDVPAAIKYVAVTHWGVSELSRFALKEAEKTKTALRCLGVATHCVFASEAKQSNLNYP